MLRDYYSKTDGGFDAGDPRGVLRDRGVVGSRGVRLQVDCPGWAGVLGCDLELAAKTKDCALGHLKVVATMARGWRNERSGSSGVGEFGGGAGGEHAEDGCRIFVGLLVSGDAERGDLREESGEGDVVGGAAGAWKNDRGEGVCDAGRLSAPWDSTFIRAF
jgi:hypothetical protein